MNQISDHILKWTKTLTSWTNSLLVSFYKTNNKIKWIDQSLIIVIVLWIIYKKSIKYIKKFGINNLTKVLFKIIIQFFFMLKKNHNSFSMWLIYSEYILNFINNLVNFISLTNNTMENQEYVVNMNLAIDIQIR
jgi:hypothetical protein